MPSRKVYKRTNTANDYNKSDVIASFTNNAEKKRAFQVYTSLGVNCQMIACLSPLEQINLQQLNIFFYHNAVSRVQY